MSPTIADSDAEIVACHPVMQALRPHVKREEFLARVRRQGADGYRLAYLQEGGKPLSVAGFRILENLAWGRFLYVDDLVTLPEARSRGCGAKLLGWLHELARAEGCAQLHLDSGMARRDAHRFYEREGLERSGYHFRSVL